MASFHNQLLSKALELYPSLTVEDLKPYLFRSRSTNAYDAMNLLARSMGVALDQASGEDCANSSQTQLALEKIYMVCISHVFFIILLAALFLNNLDTDVLKNSSKWYYILN